MQHDLGESKKLTIITKQLIYDILAEFTKLSVISSFSIAQSMWRYVMVTDLIATMTVKYIVNRNILWWYFWLKVGHCRSHSLRLCSCLWYHKSSTSQCDSCPTWLKFLNQCFDRSDSANNQLQSLLQAPEQTCLAHFPYVWHFGSRIITDITGPQLILFQNSVFLFLKPSSLLYCDSAIFFTVSAPLPQLSTWCANSLDAQVYIFLVFPVFKQQQLLIQQPEGIRANSNSPVGSAAIIEPLLDTREGSCFLSDQTASLPQGTPASSHLAAPGKWGRLLESWIKAGC